MNKYCFIKAPRVDSFDSNTLFEWLICTDAKVKKESHKEQGSLDSISNDFKCTQEENLILGKGSLAEAADIFRHQTNSSIIFVVPGEDVRAINVKLPNKSKSALSTVPFQIEEKVSSSIESLHIATSEVKENNRSVTLDTLVVNHEKMRLWRDLGHNMGVEFNYILADYSLLPINDDCVFVYHSKARVLIKSQEFNGVFTPKLFEKLSNTIWPIETEKRTVITNSKSDNEQSSILPMLAETFIRNKDEKFINLLQGQYEMSVSRFQRASSFKLPSFIALGLVFILLVLALFDNYQLQKKADFLDTQMVILYQKIYPNDRRIDDPFLQMRGKLKNGTVNQGANFIAWLTIIGPLLREQDITTTNLRYDREGLSMRIQLEANDYNALEQFVQKVNQTSFPFSANLGSLQKSASSQKVTSIVIIRDKQDVK